ncbi:MAG TPA: hypothetical protein VEC10_09555, partial [Steroidobacteraceae bacterium]|nr:hypothetical protein [Steroidobacteraceae bacterium]
AYLARLAVHELEQQKDRLAAYQVQARFALATMYDRAASAQAAHGKPQTPVQKGAEEGAPDTGEPAAHPQDEAPATQPEPPR